MVFTCEACGSTLHKNDIDFGTGIASCPQCQAVMSFAKEMGLEPAAVSAAHSPYALPPDPGSSAQQSQPGVRQRALAPKPARVQVEQSVTGLKLIRPWYTPSIIGQAIFCIFWDGFLVFWYTIGIREGELLMLLFPILHLAVGVSLTYSTLAGFFNRSVITVNDATLRIANGPFPWRGNQSIPVDQIVQLYCDESRGNNSTWANLSAVLKNGEKQKILTGLPDPDVAIYLEQQIEKQLGIQDAPVAGEIV